MPLDLLSPSPCTPLAAHNYVRRLEEHQFKAHRMVQVQLARAIQRSARRYGDEKDAVQTGENLLQIAISPFPTPVPGGLSNSCRALYARSVWKATGATSRRPSRCP